MAFASAGPVVLALLILAATALFASARDRPRLFAGATGFLQMTLFTVLGVVLSYALAAQSGPLWDDRLATADAWLHLDWARTFRLVDRLPAMLWVGGLAYYSLVAQMIVCIVVLSGLGQVDTLRIAVAAAVLSGAVTIAISGWMPAIGNLFDPAAFHHLWPSVAWQERALIDGLRAGSTRVLDIGHLSGIVSFPSYHATLPIILAWAQRDVPVLKVASPIWAGTTIVATPLFGGHYGVDVLGGMALAIAAITLAPRLATARWLADRARVDELMLKPNRVAVGYAAQIGKGC